MSINVLTQNEFYSGWMKGSFYQIAVGGIPKY